MRRIVVGAALVAFAVVSVGAGAAHAAGSSLIDAIRNGDAATVRALLKQPGGAKAASPDGTTALHWAVHRDDLAVTDLLLTAGADVKAANRFGATPLSMACVNGNAAIIERLVAAGADVNAASAGGATPLMIAARTGRVDAIKALVQHGANVNARELADGQTALMWAAARNNAEAVKVLIEVGADIKATAPGSRVKPPAALVENDTESLGNRTREAGAFKSFQAPKPPTFSALDYAVREGHLEAVRALVDGGADVNRELEDGSTPLLRAILNNHHQLAMFLLEKGANAKASRIGWTPLHHVAVNRRPNVLGPGTPWAIPTGTTDSLDLIRKLVSLGADVNARMTNDLNTGSRRIFSRFGATPFLLAAKTCDVAGMKLLLELGADPRLRTDAGETATILAAGLLIWGPGEDPGTEEECLEATQVALNAAPEQINGANVTGDTALHGATMRGFVSIIDYLVEKGAKLDAINDKGWAPWTVADGVFYANHVIGQPAAKIRIDKLMADRGLSTEGLKSDPTNFDCVGCTTRSAGQIEAQKKRQAEWKLEREKSQGKAERPVYVAGAGAKVKNNNSDDKLDAEGQK